MCDDDEVCGDEYVVDHGGFITWLMVGFQVKLMSGSWWLSGISSLYCLAHRSYACCVSYWVYTLCMIISSSRKLIIMIVGLSGRSIFFPCGKLIYDVGVLECIGDFLRKPLGQRGIALVSGNRLSLRVRRASS